MDRTVWYNERARLTAARSALVAAFFMTVRPASAQDPEAAEASETSGEVTVTVSGVRAHPHELPRAPSVSGSVVTRERLEQPGMHAGDVLREAPGVQIVEGGFGAPATASLRGATASQTPVYLGGVLINDEAGGGASLTDVPLFLIERVDVYRSHAPLVASRLGVGGAIFFEPRRPEGPELSAGGLVGSYGSRSGWLYASAGNGARGVLAGIELSAADNDYSFSNDRGTLFVTDDDGAGRLANADARVQNAWIHARESIGRASLSLLANHVGREQGALKLASLPSKEARVAFGRDLIALSAAVPVDDWNGAVKATTSATQTESVIDDPLSELGWLTPYTRLLGERLEQSVLAEQSTASGLKFAQQLSVSLSRLRRFELENTVSRQKLAARRALSRAAASAEVPLGGDWFIDGLAAFECIDTSLDSLGACESAVPSGRGALSYRVPAFTAYANAGHYNRLPALGELYGVSFLVRGNSNLKTEIGDTAELGARFQLLDAARRARLWFDGAGFLRVGRRHISYVRTPAGFVYPQNRRTARFLGLEAALGAAPLPFLELSANASLLSARDISSDRTTENDILPFKSPLTAAALVTVRRDFESELVNAGTVSLRYLYRSSRFADRAGLMVIPEHASLDAELAGFFVYRRLVARLRITNLLARRRFDIVGFPLPRRSAFLSMEATW